jgi:hypothetical protein
MMVRLRRAAVPLFLLPILLGYGRPADTGQSDAKIWVGRYREIEEYLRTAECISKSAIGPGPAARCQLAPGGPAARMAWKPIAPGVYRGFRESYKADIAAYEMDKLLKLDMVPPTVERQLDGTLGAAQLWVENSTWMKDGASPGASNAGKWENQLVRMAMFDALIGCRDRNLANTLRDDEWGMILVDHSRAFQATSELPRRLSQVDRAFWDRIEKLTRAELDATLGQWLDAEEIGAIVGRRDNMRTEIRPLLK